MFKITYFAMYFCLLVWNWHFSI